jgi:drug/metabolite transporter (DMT)-like permease
MTRLIAILLVALILEALGVVYLSNGLKQIGGPRQMNVREITRVVGRGIRNGNILIGVAMETVFFVSLLVLLKLWDVSLVWPLTSLGFVLTTLAAKYIRHEEVNAMRWAGVFLIMAGAVMVGYSERLKNMPEKALPGTANETHGAKAAE